MSTITKTNIILDATSANNSFSAVWWLSRCMKKAGWSVLASSDGTTKDTSGVAASDKWGGNADPLLDTYPTAFDAKAPWLVLDGPRTVKVSITAVPTGTFLRGEGVTQATSGATGELLGYVINAAGNSGWAIIMPRTGTFNGTNVITGDTSAATLTATAVAFFARQVVFWKSISNVTDGSVYYICADVAAETAQLFSTLAANANCTATIAPAGSPTAGNQFPVLAICCRGTSAVAAGAAASHQNLFWTSANLFGRAQIAAVNAVPATGVSADGTFWVAISNTSAANTFISWSFHRLDDSEPGDVEPFAWYFPSGEGVSGSTNRTQATSSNGNNTTWNNMSGGLMSWRGYCARGTGGAKDAFVALQAAVPNATGSSTAVAVSNASDTMRLANHPDAVAPVTQEPLFIFSDKTAFKIRKGATRWMVVYPIGTGLDTFDSKQWIVILTQSSTSNPAIALGPYDGATTPLPT